ncbi:DUF192 domain-containing protein [Nitrosovibrio tenuis]|uniref:DUF192 domain-containing protein n=1 Tax=Nitrosovibrio tenuis TaxID=1233 RepID=A0A1H7QCP2_9PROT|nr:DUF192 domain-containing protein [Nitrosovibrio tenuis]SEL45732.1 hypothetical protein SAMN05216387_11173 [Nitrosovibrio tenuis]
MALAVPANIDRLIVLLLGLLLSAPLRAEMPVTQLRISRHNLTVEIAHTEATRSQGLMFRQSMDENRGMLFVFPQPGRYSMWMMNTDIPLSVAFVDEKGIILNIANMIPRTATGHPSAGAAKYAIETNLGWFQTRNVTPGDRVMGLEKAPQAE